MEKIWIWIALGVSCVGLLAEVNGLFWREWRWLWASLAAASLFAGIFRAKTLRPWALVLCTADLLVSAVALRSWSGAVDVLPVPMFCAAFLAGTVAEAPRGGNRLLVLLLAGSFVLGLGLADFMTLPQPWRAKGDYMVAGLFAQRNTLLMFAAVSLGFWIWEAKRATALWAKVWSGLLAVVSFTAPFGERSLTAWTALAVGCAVFPAALTAASERIPKAAKLALVGAVAVVLALVAFGGSAAKLVESKAGSVLARAEIYEAAERAGLETLPWGEGLGGFSRVSSALRPSDTLSGIPHFIGNVSGAHNHLLQAWAERGIPGAAAVLLVAAAVCGGAVSSLRRRTPERAEADAPDASVRKDVLFAPLLCAAAAMAAVHACFDLSSHAFPITCGLFGLVCGKAAAQFPSGLLDRIDAALLARLPGARLRRCVIGGLALLALWGCFLAQQRVRSEEAAGDATALMAVRPGEVLKGVAESLEIDPSNPLPRWLLVGFLRTNGMADDASEHLDYLEKVSGNRFPIAEERAQLAVLKGDWEAVLEQSSAALRNNALWNNKMWMHKALALAELGRCAEFETARRDGLNWSWNPDRPAPVRIRVPEPDLRDRTPMLRDLQTLEMLRCPLR